MTVEVVNETTATIDLDTVRALAEHCMAAMKVHPHAELAVIFVDETAMEKLHIEWMDEPGPTDVLSFGVDEDSVPIGPRGYEDRTRLTPIRALQAEPQRALQLLEPLRADPSRYVQN